MNVAAVIVTRGDVDLEPIMDSLCDAVDHIAVWDNGPTNVEPLPGRPPMNGYTTRISRNNLAVYGRYAAIEHTEAPVVLVQDDDVVLPRESIDALLAAYQPGHIVANMPARFRPHYPDSCLVGFGAIFDRDLPAQAFERYDVEVLARHEGAAGWPPPQGEFHRTCDVVFTTLTPRILLDLPYTDREFASDANRMWKQPGHHGERVRMLELAREVRDRVPA